MRERSSACGRVADAVKTETSRVREARRKLIGQKAWLMTGARPKGGSLMQRTMASLGSVETVLASRPRKRRNETGFKVIETTNNPACRGFVDSGEQALRPRMISMISKTASRLIRARTPFVSHGEADPFAFVGFGFRRGWKSFEMSAPMRSPLVSGRHGSRVSVQADWKSEGSSNYNAGAGLPRSRAFSPKPQNHLPTGWRRKLVRGSDGQL